MKRFLSVLLNAAVVACLSGTLAAQTFPGLIPTDRLLGRDSDGSGQVETLTVGGGLDFTGSGGIAISDAELTCLAGLTSAADKFPYFTGSGTCALADISSDERTFLTTPSSANLATVLSDETGSGAAVFGTGPTINGATIDDTGTIGISATTKTNIESAIDTLGNLTSIQGVAVAYADAGADALWCWDDDISTYTNCTLSNVATEASPASGDYLPLIDASGVLKKVDWSSLPGSGSLPGDPGFDAVLLWDDTIDNQAEWHGLADSFATIANPAGGMNAPYNVGLAVSASAGALTVALKGADGNDPSSTNPVLIPFQSATGTTGTPTWLRVTTATSVTLTSGSTAGVTSSTAFRLWVEGCNDGGTFKLGLFNASTASRIYPLREEQLQSSTDEGGAGGADSAGVLYTDDAVTAISSKACRILGFAEWSSGGVTAGTWTTTNLIYVRLYSPGTKKPGDVIQTSISTDSTTRSTTSTSFVATATTGSITLTSAANFVRATADIVLKSGASAVSANAQWSRGTSDNTNLFGGGTAAYSASGGSIISAGTIIGYDKPDATSAQTYAVQLKTSNASNAADLLNAAGLPAYLVLEEIMG